MQLQYVMFIFVYTTLMSRFRKYKLYSWRLILWFRCTFLV